MSISSFTANGVGQRVRRDWSIALVLFIIALALQAHCRSRLAYHWDSAEFVLAMREYNVSLSQPHAPGYFLYIMLGRLINFFVEDPHASLVWLSMVTGSGVVALLYVLGTEMFERRIGLAAALFAMTSPQLWFHSCVALTYVPDSFFVCTAVFCCWRLRRNGGRWVDAIVIGGLLAFIGGIRPQTVPGLVPLVVYALWASEDRRMKKLALAFLVCAIGTLAWLVPMISMSGGWSIYLETFHRHQLFNAPSTLAAGGTEALLWNVFFMVLFCCNGLTLGVVLLVCALVLRVRMVAERKSTWDAAHREALRILALWIGPMVVMGTIVALTRQPGYVLSYLPALTILVAVAVSGLQKPIPFWTVTAAICLVNAVVFLAWPLRWDGVFFHTGRTAREIREHDQQLALVVSTVRRELNPEETVICHAREHLPLGLRHLQLYLPEFEEYQLALDPVMMSPAGKPMMRIRKGRLEFARGIDSSKKRIVALVVPRGTSLEDYAAHFDLSGARPLPDSGGCVYTVPVEALR